MEDPMTAPIPPQQPAKKKGMSTGLLVGLILGGLFLLIVPVLAIIAAIAIPNLLRSRMAANESAAIGACKTFAAAEDTYRRVDYDGNKVPEYATSLKELAARGLVSSRTAGAEATAPSPTPQAGYYFKVLTAQGSGAPGWAKSYLNQNGNMVSGYALLAYPAMYDSSGRNCFLISASGTIYEKDLGANTDQIAQSMTEYDPTGWIAAE